MVNERKLDMVHSKLAAQLYTVRKFTQTAQDLAATLKKIRTIGYTAVQVSGIGSIPPTQVKTIVDEAGLVICNTHVSVESLWQYPDAIIEQHHLWSCRHVAIGGMPEAYKREGEAGFKRFAQEASHIGEILFSAGLTFSYHNHSFEFVRFGKRTGLDIIYQESDSRYLQAEIDTYWVQHGGGDPVAWITKMEGRMPVIHLKDMVIEDGKQSMAEIGEGNLNWPAILKACQDTGVEWYAIEQDDDFSTGGPFESLRISYDNLRTMGVE
jgi:sugar phosphate isomerase/epimerase